MKLGPVGNFEISGSLAYKASGTTWDNPSDVRLKENIQDYTKGLTELVQINPKTWTTSWKNGRPLGLSMSGVAIPASASISRDARGVWALKYSMMILLNSPSGSGPS